jgi:hypothetical protein
MSLVEIVSSNKVLRKHDILFEIICRSSFSFETSPHSTQYIVVCHVHCTLMYEVSSRVVKLLYRNGLLYQVRLGDIWTYESFLARDRIVGESCLQVGVEKDKPFYESTSSVIIATVSSCRLSQVLNEKQIVL